MDRLVPGFGRVSISTSARTGTKHRRALVLFDKLVRGGRLDEAGRPLSSIQATLGHKTLGHKTLAQTAQYAKQRLRRADSEALAGQIAGLLKDS